MTMGNMYKDWSEDNITQEEAREAEECGMSLEEYLGLDDESFRYIQSHSDFNDEPNYD